MSDVRERCRRFAGRLTEAWQRRSRRERYLVALLLLVLLVPVAIVRIWLPLMAAQERQRLALGCAEAQQRQLVQTVRALQTLRQRTPRPLPAVAEIEAALRQAAALHRLPLDDWQFSADVAGLAFAGSGTFDLWLQVLAELQSRLPVELLSLQVESDMVAGRVRLTGVLGQQGTTR